MIPEYLLDQVFSTDEKRHLATDGRETLCGLPNKGSTDRIHPCDCEECRKQLLATA